MWKSTVESGAGHRWKYDACALHDYKYTHYRILTACPQQQWLHERTAILHCYYYVHCLSFWNSKYAEPCFWLTLKINMFIFTLHNSIILWISLDEAWNQKCCPQSKVTWFNSVFREIVLVVLVVVVVVVITTFRNKQDAFCVFMKIEYVWWIP
jgi:hypothetical protein